MRIIHLFADTNLFVQCRPLDQLDWSPWQEFDEVHVIVTHPVQKEIDAQKNKGNDRLGKRARTTNSLFRDIILADVGHKLIKQESPCVKIFIKPEYNFSKEHGDQLNFQEADDQLVGIVLNFKEKNLDKSASLVTHDTGPMSKAKMVGVPFHPIPDEWLLPPESSADEKAISSLKNEIDKLKSQEPKIEIECLDKEKKRIDQLRVDLVRYQPLSKAEIAEAIEYLKKRSPFAKDFGPKKEQLRLPTYFEEIYVPTSNEDIQKYSRKYSDWIAECAKIFENCHVNLNYKMGRAILNFFIENKGTRPAKDALVRFLARGNITIMPPRGELNFDMDDYQSQEFKHFFPEAPERPSGSWRSIIAGEMYNVEGFLSSIKGMNELTILPLTPRSSERDSNSFYYKSSRPESPCASYELECSQWRHTEGPFDFHVEIRCSQEGGEINGVLECQVHAENMHDVISKVIPVRGQIRPENALDKVKELIRTSFPLL